MRLRTRLGCLEQRLRIDDGCPACRLRRGQTTVVYSQRLPDGSTERRGVWPVPCARCSQVPEMIVEVVAPLSAEGTSKTSWDVEARVPGEGRPDRPARMPHGELRWSSWAVRRAKVRSTPVASRLRALQ